MNTTPPIRAVTFDFGQTLAELDSDMLARRLGERGVRIEASCIDPHVKDAFVAYSKAIQAGAGGHPWSLLMRYLLTTAGAPADRIEELVAWLWSEQPARNLWRRPIPHMIDIVHDLRASGIPVGIISNSEGRLAELASEMGWGALFEVIADSGKLGLEKPGREIFAYTAEKLGVDLRQVVHIGDAFAADVEGALAAGMRAIWFQGDETFAASPHERLRICQTPRQVRDALHHWGLPL